MANNNNTGGGGGQGSTGGTPARRPSVKMTSDNRFKQFVQTRLVRDANGLTSHYETVGKPRTVPSPVAPSNMGYTSEGRHDFVGKQAQPQQNPLVHGLNQPDNIFLPVLRKSWNDALSRKPSPSNPFGEPTGKTDVRQDALAPHITPEIRAMAAVGSSFVDLNVVTPDYIKNVAKQDNDLAKRLAWNYMDEYSRRLMNGYVTDPLPDDTVKDLNNIGQRQTADDFVNGVGGVFGGAMKLIDQVTRAPIKIGAFKTLETGFEQQPKNIDPLKIKPEEVESVQIANVDTFKLPKYYRDQIDAAASPIEELLYPGLEGQRDANPERDRAYQRIVDRVMEQRKDWEYYSDFATAADGINTLVSAPGVRTAQMTGGDISKSEGNILGTGGMAGLTTFSRVTQFVKDLKDAGVTIDEEDRQSLRQGWAAETVDKYAERLREKGGDISDIVSRQGMTWNELKQNLDLAKIPLENQIDIARSLGYKVDDYGGKAQPIYVTRYTGAGQVMEEVGSELKFKVDDADRVVSMDDITKADSAGITGAELAALVGAKRAYSYLAEVKTVPAQDLAASLVFDATNFGKLQLIYEPIGLMFKGLGKVAKIGGKGVLFGTAALGDAGVGAAKTVGNLIGKLKGVEKQILKPEDWHSVSDAARFIISESAQSITNKVANRAFFVTKSIIAPEYLKDGEGTLKWVDEVLPRLQSDAESGTWTSFIREVPAGAGDYAAQGLNAIRQDIKRVVADEDAYGRFADALVKPFGNEIEKEEVDALRVLAEKGDYAGIVRWLADKHVSQRITGGMEVEDARKSLAASDLINHVTSAYRSGINVLSEKELNVFGQEISPAAQRVNSFLSSVSRQWTNAVLTARPGWNIINYIDNNARLLANGFNPSADVQDYERILGEMGVTPTQLRQIISGGNFADETVRLGIPVTQEALDAAKFAEKITVDSEPRQIENVIALTNRAIASLDSLSVEEKQSMEDIVRRLKVEADKLSKGKGDVKSLRDAAAKVNGLSNKMYGRTAALDTKLFKSRVETLKEYYKTMLSGDGKAITRIWNNWVELGHAVHRDIESAARMRAFAPTFIDKYHEALEKITVGLPKFPDEAQLAERFAHIVDPRDKAEAIQETLDVYNLFNQRLGGMANEMAFHPNQMPDVQAYLDDMVQNPLSAARNFVFSTQPRVNGHMIPAADALMQKVSNWITDGFDGMNHGDLADPAEVKRVIEESFKRIDSRLRVESAEANMMARTNEIIQPTTHVPDSVVNWMQDGQVTNPRDIQVTVRRMEKVQHDIEGINQQMRDQFVELNHEPYLNALDATYQRVPDRMHRYDIMRESFAEKYAGEATYAGETVKVVGGTSSNVGGKPVAMAVLEDGRRVPIEGIEIADPQRKWYFERYAKWEKTKPTGNNILTRSGISDVSGEGAKLRRPAYATTGTEGRVPPEIARGYTRRMEDDLVAKGGTIPTEYTDADGVKHMLAYDSADDFVQRFASGSGLGFYQKGQGDLMQGVQRIADNWVHLGKMADATEIADLADVYIDGRKITEIYGPDVELSEIKKRIFGEKKAKVSIKFERDGVSYNLVNDPKRGETLTDVTRRMWGDKLEGVYAETRGQWIPVFDPNAPAGKRISFQKIGRDEGIESLRQPIQVGTSIPDEMGGKLLEIQEIAEPVEQIGIQVEAAFQRLDNMLKASPPLPEFKSDAVVNGVDVMSTGKIKRMPDGVRGLEVVYPDGRREVVPAHSFEWKREGEEIPAAQFVAGSPEQKAAEAGVKTAEQQATIQATNPVVEFMRRHPALTSRSDLLERGALLREAGVNVSDDQLNGMADTLESLSKNMFKQDDPDFLLKKLSLTPRAPTEGLYQKAEVKMTRQGWLTNEERKEVFDQTLKEVTSPVDAPPVRDGFTRLYRGESSKTVPPSDWVKQGQDELGITEAQGRWFTDDPKIAQWYVDDAGENGRMMYVDLPSDVVDSYRVSRNKDVSQFSRDPNSEFFIPKDSAGDRRVFNQPAVDHLVDRARGYPASSGLVGASGEPLFSRSDEGEILGAFKMLFGDKPGEGVGMIHLGPNATMDTVSEEFMHGVLSFAELSEEALPGPEFAEVRKELRKQLDIVADAVGAPKLEHAAQRGPKKYRRVMYQELYKVNRAESGLDDAVKWEAFVAEAKGASERAAEMFKNYLRTGKAPTKELQGVFTRFKEWLGGIFHARWNRGEQLPVEVKKVFDQWMAESPEWADQLTKKGSNFFKNNEPALKQAAKNIKMLDEWSAAVENLRVAYGGWNDSPAIDKFHEVVKRTTRKLKKFASTGDAAAKGSEWLDSPEGIRLTDLMYDIDDAQVGLTKIDQWRPKEKTSMAQVTEDILSERKTKITKVTPQLRAEHKAELEATIKAGIDEARKIGVEIPDDSKAVQIIDKFLEDANKATVKTSAEGSVADIIQPVWDAYKELLEDGKYYPKQINEAGEWVYPETAGPIITQGKLKGGRPDPKNQEYRKSVDEFLAQERGAPASLDELAALNAPQSTYVSPALVDLLKYHAGVRSYINQWKDAMLAAVDGGFTPGRTMRGLSIDDYTTARKFLEDYYGQLGRAASFAQGEAERKTNLVMMDFETTYNLDRLMQQGPALPSWAGKAAGVRPLRIGGIVPFFKFPRENIESWINTLGSHPSLVHNIQKYQEQGNIERKRFGLSSQWLPTWPIGVGDKVMSVSPFAFISIGQMIRSFSPYIDEDAKTADQVLGVAGQLGFSVGPTLRAALVISGLSEEQQSIIPQAQALISPALHPYISSQIKSLLGITSNRDEFYIKRQLVYDALADLSVVESEGAKKNILAELDAAISSPTHPRSVAASEHYYNMNFMTANTGYWSGVYPREVSKGELDLKKYKTDIAQLRSAMVGAGLSPDRVDLIEGYLAGDPKAIANRKLNSLYNVDPSTAVSGTLSEAWKSSVADAGRRSEYFEQRAMIEAEFQQKYGFSGTNISDADRAEYDKRITALNGKYADALTPKKVSRYPTETDEQYHRDVATLWLEYMSNTKPEYTRYETYAEWEKAVKEWEDNLPNMSKSMWKTIHPQLGAFTTQATVQLPGYLEAISNKAAMEKFETQYDTVSRAIYKTLRDHYYSGYYDAVNGKVGPKRLLSEMEYKLQHPVPGDDVVQKWLNDGLYSGRFTKQDILRELKAHPAADIEQSILAGKTLPEKQAYDLGKLLSRIPPGKAYFNFLDTLPKDIQKHLQTFQDSSYTYNPNMDKWLNTYETIKTAIGGQFKEPSLTMVREWVSAERENDTMESTRSRMFPGIKSTLDTYNAIDRADTKARKAYRTKHPEVNQYYDWLYNEWQNTHPLWNKYYGNGDSDKSVGSTARPSGTSYVTGKVNKYSTGGSRSSGGFRASYTSTNGVATGPLADQWQGFRSMAGSELYNALTNHYDTGSGLTDSESSLLQKLYTQYPFGATSYEDWLNNVLPKMRSAMIPGESIFSKNKRYDNQQNQPQTQFGYTWFGKGRNAG